MCTGPEQHSVPRTGPTSFMVNEGRVLQGLVFLVVLSAIISCAGTGTSGAGTNGESTDTPPSSSEDVPEEELDQLLEQQQKRQLKPSENSPGPIMVSFFARRGSSSDGVMRQDTGKQLPARGGRSGERREEGQSEYQYMILLSKEWAYENRPINERFLDVAQPDVKIMKDWRMNRYIKFLNENRFSDFPAMGSVSQEQIQDMAPGEKIITYWEGDEFRRVYFREQMEQQMMNSSAWSGQSSEALQKAKNRLLIGYLRAFNAAGLSRMQVNIGPTPSRKRLDQLAEQASPSNQENIQAELFRAQKLHENGAHRKARKVLMNVIDKTRGTTYRADAQALLQSINQALQTDNNE